MGLATAQAASLQCRALAAELASLKTNSGNKAQFNKYDQAVRKQRTQLARAKQQADRGRCRKTVFKIGRSAICTRLDSVMDKMQANIVALEKKRNSYGRSDASSRSRIIQTKMRSLRCDANIQNASIQNGKQNGIARIFGTTKQITPNYANNIPGGNYRTLCVRPSDGYYFPISFSADKSQLQQDAQSCETRCPGAELFFHRNESEEPEDMRSIDGTLYRDTPNAFRYRTEGLDRLASCKYTEGFAVSYKLLNKSSGQPTEMKVVEGVKQEIAVYSPIPSERPQPGQSREALMDTRGGMTLDRITGMIESGSTGEALASRPSDGIRVVGPVFLPAQEAATNLQVPGRVVDQ